MIEAGCVESTANMASLEVLRGLTGVNSAPSEESIRALQGSDLVLMAGQFVGAGKSTFIQALEADGRVNIPSWTNRDLRPGEVEGVDKVTATLSEMAEMAVAGYFLELEEVRPKVFYATPSGLASNGRYVKDLELKGALRLRSLAPEIPIVVPLPPVREAKDLGVTEWERRVVLREGFRKGVTDKAITDLTGRLQGVIDETDRVLDTGLANDPNMLFVINDVLGWSLSAMRAFIANGEKKPHGDIEVHLQILQHLAAQALQGI